MLSPPFRRDWQKASEASSRSIDAVRCAHHILRNWLVVTPPMHRIHHSDKRIETDSNYGNALSLWDRLFGSYTDAPSAGLRIGLERWREAKDQRLGRMLSLPFRRDWRNASEA